MKWLKIEPSSPSISFDTAEERIKKIQKVLGNKFKKQRTNNEAVERKMAKRIQSLQQQ